MYFVSHKGRFLRSALLVPARLRYLFTVVLWLSIIGLWYCLAYQSLISLEKKYQRVGAVAEQHRIQLQTKLRELVVLEQTCSDEKKQIANVFEKQGEFSKNVEFLLELAGKHSLVLHSYVSSSEVIKDWYVQNSIYVKLQGSFDALGAFLEELPSLVSRAKIESIEVQKIRGDVLQILLFVNFILVREAEGE